MASGDFLNSGSSVCGLYDTGDDKLNKWISIAIVILTVILLIHAFMTMCENNRRQKKRREKERRERKSRK
jgi:hypothetical protein